MKRRVSSSTPPPSPTADGEVFSSDLPFNETDAGLILHTRVTPRSSSARLGAVEMRDGKPVLVAHVTAPPEGDKANDALVALIAKHFDVPKSSVCLIAGRKSRLKSLLIRADRQHLLSILTAICGRERS